MFRSTTLAGTLALCVACACQAPPEEAPLAAVPGDLSIDIINPSRPSALRCAPEVRLGRKVSTEILEAVARRIREQETVDCSFSFAAFYLPHMEPGSGAWAIAEFHPEAVVTVLGLSVGEEQRLLEEARELPGLLGAWVDDTSYASVITLRRTPSGLVMERLYPEGRVDSDEVRIRRRAGTVRLADQDTDLLGRYYTVSARGDLETRDDYGTVSVSPKLRQPADLAQVAGEEQTRRVERTEARRERVVQAEQAADKERWRRLQAWLEQYRTSLGPVRHHVIRLASVQEVRARHQACNAFSAALAEVPPSVRESPEQQIDIAPLEEILSRMNDACMAGRQIQVMVNASSAIATWRKLDRDLRELVARVRVE